MLAVLRTQGRVFLLLDSSLLRAHTVFLGSLPCALATPFALSAGPSFSTQSLNVGGSSKLVLGPFFLSYTHSKMGSTLPSPSDVTYRPLALKPFLHQTSLSFNP